MGPSLGMAQVSCFLVAGSTSFAFLGEEDVGEEPGISKVSRALG